MEIDMIEWLWSIMRRIRRRESEREKVNKIRMAWKATEPITRIGECDGWDEPRNAS